MKNKKGFTLIELLAIIVILAIIAVITVPVILGIIDNAKKGAAVDSAHGFKESVEKYYLSEMIDNPHQKLDDGIYTVSSDNNGVTLTGTSIYTITVSGEKPKSGTVIISNNAITGGNIEVGDYCVDLSTMEATSGSCGMVGCASDEEEVEIPEYSFVKGDLANKCEIFFKSYMECYYLGNGDDTNECIAASKAVCDGTTYTFSGGEEVSFASLIEDDEYLVNNLNYFNLINEDSQTGDYSLINDTKANACMIMSETELLRLVGGELSEDIYDQMVQISNSMCNDKTMNFLGIERDVTASFYTADPDWVAALERDGIIEKRNVKYCKSKDQDCFDYYIDEGSNAVITSYTCGATDYVMDDPDNNIGHYVYDENSISNVKIPSNIIADNARFTVSTLEEWSFGDAGLTSVIIPDTVKIIGADAFHYNNITSITLPNSVTDIGASAFKESGLNSVVLSNNLTNIYEEAFADNNLSNITIPNSVRQIGWHAFYNNNLNNITINDFNNLIIDNGAFGNNPLDNLSDSTKTAIENINNQAINEIP